jgi:hypothetical protein
MQHMVFTMHLGLLAANTITLEINEQRKVHLVGPHYTHTKRIVRPSEMLGRY